MANPIHLYEVELHMVPFLVVLHAFVLISFLHQHICTGLARTIYIFTVYNCNIGDYPAKNYVQRLGSPTRWCS